MDTKRESTNFREMLGIIFARLPFIKRIFLLCAAVSLLVPFCITTKYTLTGEIAVLSKKLQQGIRGDITLGVNARYIPASVTDIETESNIIRSIPLIQKTVADLYDEGVLRMEYSLVGGLIVNPVRKYIVSPIKSIFSDNNKNERTEDIKSLTKIILDGLEVNTIPGSNIITVSYESDDSDLAQKFVNKLMANFLIKHDELLLNEAPQDFFIQKRNSYKDRLVSLELQKISLFKKHAVTNTKDEMTFLITSINKENEELNELIDKRVESSAWLNYLELKLDELRTSDVTTMSFPYSFGAIETSRNTNYVDTEMKEQTLKISNLQSEYMTVGLAFRKESKKSSELFDQLKQEKVRLLNLVENRILERSEGIKVLNTVIFSKQSRIDTFRERAETLKEVSAQEAGITTELNAVNDAYFKYSQQYEERRSEKLANLADLSNVRILNAAASPLGPSSPKLSLVLLAGFVSSILIAFTVGALRELFDNRLHYPEQVSTQLKVPVIAVFDDIDIESEMPFSRKPDEFWKWLTQ